MSQPCFAIVRSMHQPEITAELLTGAQNVLIAAGIQFDLFEPASPHIQTAVFSVINGSKRDYDGYVALGCILKSDFIQETVAANTLSALDEIPRLLNVPFGNGILIIDTLEQAQELSIMALQDHGGEAARKAISAYRTARKLPH